MQKFTYSVQILLPFLFSLRSLFGWSYVKFESFCLMSHVLSLGTPSTLFCLIDSKSHMLVLCSPFFYSHWFKILIVIVTEGLRKDWGFEWKWFAFLWAKEWAEFWLARADIHLASLFRHSSFKILIVIVTEGLRKDWGFEWKWFAFLWAKEWAEFWLARADIHLASLFRHSSEL